MSIGDIRKAMLIVWIVLAVVATAAAALPMVASADTIDDLAAQCRRDAHAERPCVLCGMTTAFLYISEGEFTRAQTANAGSVPLYLLFCLNGAALAGWVGRKVIRSRSAKEE